MSLLEAIHFVSKLTESCGSESEEVVVSTPTTEETAENPSLAFVTLSEDRPHTAQHGKSFLAKPKAGQTLGDVFDEYDDSRHGGFFVSLYQHFLDSFNTTSGTSWTRQSQLDASQMYLINEKSNGLHVVENMFDLSQHDDPEIAITPAASGNLFDVDTEVFALYSDVKIGDEQKKVMVRIYTQMEDNHRIDAPSPHYPGRDSDEDFENCYNNKPYTYVEIYIEDENGTDLVMQDGTAYTIEYKGLVDDSRFMGVGHEIVSPQADEEGVLDLIAKVDPHVATLDTGDEIAYSGDLVFGSEASDDYIIGSFVFVPTFAEAYEYEDSAEANDSTNAEESQ